jgi:hypothetical protein
MSYASDLIKTMNCKCSEHARLISEQHDRSLPAGVRHGMKLHQLLCRGCTAYEKHLKRLRVLCTMLQSQVIAKGDAMPAHVRERLSKLKPPA